MKVTRHSPERLVFRHVPVGLSIAIGIYIVGGLVAGGCTLAMAQRWTLSDDFVLIGLGAIVSTLVLGYALVRVALRVRKLTFDRASGSITLESRGLGPVQVRSWELTSLAHVDVSEARMSGGRRLHATRLVFTDGSETKLGTMDPATHDAIARNARIMNQWLRSGAAAPNESQVSRAGPLSR